MPDEEKNSITNDDLSVLRVLLHNIKGISAVSTAVEYVPEDDPTEE